MSKKEKKKSGEIESHDDEYAVDHLADAVAEHWQAEIEFEDPFEIYVQRCRSNICSDRHSFRGRLRRGYRSLLSELGQDEDKGDDISVESPPE